MGKRDVYGELYMRHLKFDGRKWRCSHPWVAEEVGTFPAYVSRIVNSREQIVNKTFLAMMDALGYDVRLTYEKRETAE